VFVCSTNHQPLGLIWNRFCQDNKTKQVYHLSIVVGDDDVEASVERIPVDCVETSGVIILVDPTSAAGIARCSCLE
jgi:hypothetical protein